MQAYYPSNESPTNALPFAEMLGSPTSSSSSSLVNSKQLDPWTLYELERETEKLKIDTKKVRQPVEEERAPVKRRRSSKKMATPAKSSSKKTSAPLAGTTNPSSRISTVLPLRHTNEGIHQMIESAKSKRKSLLLEVKVLNLYQERRSSQTASRLEDSIASLPNLEDDDDTDTLFGDNDEEEDHHKSCFF